MKTRLSLLVLIVMLLLSACQTANTPTPAVQPADSTVVLDVTGVNGSKSFTMEALKQLPATEGFAGIKSSTGKITPPETYKGILLTDLLAQVGGLDPAMAIQIEAEDGYTMTFSPNQVESGQFIAYDPGTGDETANAGTLRVLIAYERDGKALDPKEEGILRVMIINDKSNQVTDGHWSIKWVRKISLKPLAAEWTLRLEGKLTEDMDRGTFESGAAEKCHQATWQDEKAQTWMGIPLWLLVGRVDDETKHETGAFSDELADAGYTVDVVAADGYTITFDSARIKRNNNIIVAFQVNGNPLSDKDFPLKLVGSDLSKKEMAGAIVKIVVHLDGQPVSEPTPAPTATQVTVQPPSGNAALTLRGLVNNEQSWSLEQIQAQEIVKLTVEHPKKGKLDVEGVRLNALLDLAGPKPEAQTLVLIASDGFTAEADLQAIRQCPDCLLAIEDGILKAMMPGFESNFWVKDVTQIELK